MKQRPRLLAGVVAGIIVLGIVGLILRPRGPQPLTQITYGTNQAATSGGQSLLFNGRQLYRFDGTGKVANTTPEQLLPAIQNIQYNSAASLALIHVDSYAQGDFLYQTMQQQLGSFSASFNWWLYNFTSKQWQVVPFELNNARFLSDNSLLGIRKPGSKERASAGQSADAAIYANPTDEVVQISGNTLKLLGKSSDSLDVSLIQNTLYAITRDNPTSQLKLVKVNGDTLNTLVTADNITFSPRGNYAVTSDEIVPTKPTTKLVSGRMVRMSLLNPAAVTKPIITEQQSHLSWGWSSDELGFVWCQQQEARQQTTLSCHHVNPSTGKTTHNSRVGISKDISVIAVQPLGQADLLISSGNGVFTSGPGQAVNVTNLARFEANNGFVRNNGQLLLPLFAPYQLPTAASFTSSAGVASPPQVMGFRYLLYGATVYE